jgi:hypothetical protein
MCTGSSLGYVAQKLGGVVLHPSIVATYAKVRPVFVWRRVQMGPVVLTEDSLVWEASLATVVLVVDFVEMIRLVVVLRRGAFRVCLRIHWWGFARAMRAEGQM